MGSSLALLRNHYAYSRIRWVEGVRWAIGAQGVMAFGVQLDRIAS